MTIQAAIEAVNDIILANVTGVKGALDYPPDSLPEELVMLTYYGGGTSETQSSGMTKDLFDIISELHVFRKDLPRDMRLLMENLDDVRDALHTDPTLNATVSTFGYVEITPPMPADYNGMQTLMMRYILKNVKINS